MLTVAREPRFSFLLGGLLITLLAGPALLEFDVLRSGVVVQGAFSLTLIVAVWSMSESRKSFLMGIALALVTAGATIAYYLEPTTIAAVVGLGSTLTFCCLSLSLTLTFLFNTRAISANSLIGALCVYLLLGISFGVLNMLIETSLPNSFSGIETSGEDGSAISLIYYSFVTLTTLGYGDMAPVRPLAQAIAYMSSVTGQFYIAVLVAGLVSAYLNQRGSPQT